MSVFNNNIRAVFTNPVKVFIIIILPIIFILIFMYGESDIVPLRVIVIDEDNTAFSNVLVEEIDKSAKIVHSKKDEILDTLISCEADYAIIIDEGFAEQQLNGGEIKINEQFFVGEEKVFALRNNITNYINNAKIIYGISDDEEEFYKMLSAVNDRDISYEYSIKETKSAMETVQAIGFSIMFIIYSTIIIVSSIVLDKESNITPRILSSPMPITRYLGEHFASFIVLAAINVTVLMLTLRLLFGYSFCGKFMLMLGMLFLFAVSITSFSVMVLSICRKSKLFYWTMICMGTPLVMLGGCYFDIKAMPEIVQNAAKFVPTTWIMSVAREVLEHNNMDNIGITVVVFAAFTILFMSIGRIGLKQLLRASNN